MERAALPRGLTWQLGSVVELVDETPRTKSIALALPVWPGHRAGQLVDVRLTAEDGFQARRSYAIASAPEDDHVVLTVERLDDGEVSPYLVDELRPGDQLELRGPLGDYFVWFKACVGPANFESQIGRWRAASERYSLEQIVAWPASWFEIPPDGNGALERMATVRSGERMVQVDGVDLCVETFGEPGDPALLLLHGLAVSMLGWEDELCERLASGDLLVVRYDQRDTGRSVAYEPGAPQYSGEDLLGDAVGVLDALDVGAAHLVGLSAGGGLAQILAVDYPDRVLSLTLIATSPALARSSSGGLPGPSDELRAYFAAPPPPPDWSDREAVIDYLVEDERMYAARSRPFDDAERRELAGKVFDRSRSVEASMTNPFLVEDGGTGHGRLADIQAPTLVVHGEEDPLFPPAHGEALATEIPGARLVRVPRMGHELPREAWDAVVPEILRHTAGA